MATPTIDDNATSTVESNSTSHGVTMPSTVNNGDLLLIYTATNDNVTFTVPTDLGTWTLLRELTGGGSNNAHAIFGIVADGSEDAGTATYTTSSITQSASIAVVISGWGGSISDVEVSTGSAATTASPDPDSITASWGSDTNLFIASAHARRGDRAVTGYPTNYTSNQIAVDTTTASGGASIGLASRAVTAATEDPATFSLVSSTGTAAFTTVVKPAAAGGDTLLPV